MTRLSEVCEPSRLDRYKNKSFSSARDSYIPYYLFACWFFFLFLSIIYRALNITSYVQQTLNDLILQLKNNFY